jgi:hypothetical protein
VTDPLDDLDRMILAFVTLHPKCSLNDIHLAVNNGEAQECVARLDAMSPEERKRVFYERNPRPGQKEGPTR